MLTDKDELYLIDWESAIIGDPAFDLGPLLYWYVAESQWEEWLGHYEIELTEQLKKRLRWYVYYQTLVSIQLFKDVGNEEESLFWYQYLETIT